jgi:uncharacterized protein (TIGR00369 family)
MVDSGILVVRMVVLPQIVKPMSRAKTPSRKSGKYPNNYCFACGKDNPDGMRLRFMLHEGQDTVTTRLRLHKRYAGPPGYCHGGIVATILDEAMAKLNKLLSVTAVTGHLAVNYLKPVPLGQPLLVEAREINVKGRRRFRESEIVSKNGEVLARGTGVFITVDPQKLFSNQIKDPS